MLLADCREKHAWHLKEPGRSQILTHATESITQFIRKESPSAEPDLLLRVRQIELLSTIVRIDAICREFGPQSAPGSLATQASAEGLQLAEAMLPQIEQLRKNIDSRVAREARDRTRTVVAELLLMQARQNPADGEFRARATSAAEQLVKSSGDEDIRFKARCLLAESDLDNNDYKSFDLLVISLTSSIQNQAQRIEGASLKVRGLLKREQPSEALQFCLNLEKKTLQAEELSTLRLASLLHVYELLHKLDAKELRGTTAEEFRLLDHRLRPVTTGVWRECCERLVVRFGDVEKFGPEAATVIESVSNLVAAGDLTAARSRLLEMRTSFERSQPEIAATLSMQSGNLAIHLGDWQSAQTDLTSAVATFRSLGDRDQAAASDLLRIYAMSRHWDGFDSSDAAVSDQLEADYLAALEQHIADYSDLNTSTKAREWRAMLLRAADPVSAASELLDLADHGEDDHAMLLMRSGEILIDACFGWPLAAKTDHHERLTTTITEWMQQTETMLAGSQVAEVSAGMDNWAYPVLEIQRLMISLERRWTAHEDWQKLGADAAKSLDAVAELTAKDWTDPLDRTNLSDPAANQHQNQVDAAKANGAAIVALAACRQLLGSEVIQELRSQLLKTKPETRMPLVQFLLHQGSETSHPIPGDPQLGFLALDLLRDEKSVAMPIERRLAQLPVLLTASKVADNFRQFDEMIGELTAMQLNDAQLQAIATILQQRSELKATLATSTDSVKQFWRSVLDRSRSGDDQWLEASLQLATIAVQEGKLQEAEKMLKVINALHPKWGTPQRQARAAVLLGRLESAE